MNQQTPISIQNKIKYLKTYLDQLSQKVQSKKSPQEQKNQQILRIKFITFLDDNIEKIQTLNSDNPSNFKSLIESNYLSGKQDMNYKQKYFQVQKQKIQLQKKLMQLRQRQIKEQQHALDLQKGQSENYKLRHKLQTQLKELNKQIQQLNGQLSYQTGKIKHQEQQMQRLIRLNLHQNQQRQKSILQRNRAEKQVYQLRQKYQNEQSSFQAANMKGQKFNYKNTEGLRNVRIFSNVSNQKKNHEKYFLLELPVKIQLQKIVYGIRVGMILPNKEIFYFNELCLYEKDPMKIQIQGDNLAVQFLKRKQKVVLDKYKITRPQIVILLYGKGDSVLVDQTK